MRWCGIWSVMHRRVHRWEWVARVAAAARCSSWTVLRPVGCDSSQWLGGETRSGIRQGLPTDRANQRIRYSGETGYVYECICTLLIHQRKFDAFLSFFVAAFFQLFSPTDTCSLESYTVTKDYIILQLLDCVKNRYVFWNYDSATSAWVFAGQEEGKCMMLCSGGGSSGSGGGSSSGSSGGSSSSDSSSSSSGSGSGNCSGGCSSSGCCSSSSSSSMLLF